MSISCTMVPPRLAIQVLHKGSKEMEVTGHEIDTVGSMVNNFPASVPQLITGPVWHWGCQWILYMWTIWVDPGCQVSFRRCWCKGSCHLGTDELHQYSVCQDTSLGDVVGHILTNINGDDLEVWCISSAHMSHTYIYQRQTKVLGTRVSVYLLFELLYCCNFVLGLRCLCIHDEFTQLICTWILSVTLNLYCLVLLPCLSCHLLCYVILKQ